MLKLLFVGHSYHGSTGSSQFFRDLLASQCQLDIVAIDPTGIADTERLASLPLQSYAGVILWQIDYLASYFLRRGIHTIVCPMYDASSTLPAKHWAAMKQALIIAFSLELHLRIQAAGVDSLYVRYCPSPPRRGTPNHEGSVIITTSITSRENSKDGLRVFFWERLPDTAISFANVQRLLDKLNVSHLHVHCAPDPGRCSHHSSKYHSERYEVTTSNWFEDRRDYHDLLKQADIYIAPRYSEGIGMGFLEAMLEGCCVIAHDMATHNEYIENWSNGILVDFTSNPHQVLQAEAKVIRGIGQKAKQDSEQWSKGWKEFYSGLLLKRIISYISAPLNAVRNPPITSTHSPVCDQAIALLELRSLCAAHMDWDSYWGHIDDILTPTVGDDAPRVRFVLPEVNALEQDGEYLRAFNALSRKAAGTSSESIFYQGLLRRLMARMNQKLRRPSPS